MQIDRTQGNMFINLTTPLRHFWKRPANTHNATRYTNVPQWPQTQPSEKTWKYRNSAKSFHDRSSVPSWLSFESCQQDVCGWRDRWTGTGAIFHNLDKLIDSVSVVSVLVIICNTGPLAELEKMLHLERMGNLNEISSRRADVLWTARCWGS